MVLANKDLGCINSDCPPLVLGVRVYSILNFLFFLGFIYEIIHYMKFFNLSIRIHLQNKVMKSDCLRWI